MHAIRIAVDADSERSEIFFSSGNRRTTRPSFEHALREGWGVLHLLSCVNGVSRASGVIALVPGAVVLVAIDRLAHTVLLPVDLGAFASGKVAIVRAAIVADLVVH